MAPMLTDFFTLLFLNNYRNTGQCKNNTVRFHIPFTHFPSKVTFYITIINMNMRKLTLVQYTTLSTFPFLTGTPMGGGAGGGAV